MREVVAEFQNPAMFYSIGKDSSVMLHLLQKAFYSAPPPLPLVHVDTKWKFREMIEFRDARAKEVGMELIVYANPKGDELNISPFEHGSAMHTDIMKTQGLKQMLDKYIHFVMKTIDGIRKIKDLNCGIFITDTIKKGSRLGCFHFRTGLNLTSGSIYRASLKTLVT